MGGAERRTSADDDEPEIAPFFEDSGGFDPDAPNDRFSTEPVENFEGEGSDQVAEEIDPNDAGAEGFHDDTNGGEQKGTFELVPEERPGPVEVGRGFNDDFDTGPPRRDRDRDRDRGPRGGRGRSDRSDRGDRGGRDRDRDRGPRTGGSSFKGGPKTGRDRGIPKPKIEDIFKRGQEVLVQVIKEAVGTKGPTLSTYISIAGRYLVLMPSLNRVGVSRKIEDHDARRRLRDIMNTLSPPKGVGFIVRTAAVDRDAKELRNDLAYLLRLWQVVVKRIKRVAGPIEIYRESDMITRTIRDIFTNDIDTIWVDEATAFAHASEFLQIVMPKFASRIRHFESSEPLFHKYGVENEIAKIHQKRIEMPLGGSLVIEQTEALVAIDVNSGNFRADNNAEETAFQMNLHAAKEIARQLRLRDLGGVIVNDFIDMRSETHRRKVEDALRDALRRDRARTKILRISQFGLIEMTRQRIRPSLKRSIFSDCSHCRGTGYVKTSESLSIDAMRLLQLAAHRTPAIASVQVGVHIDVAHYLLNKRRKDLAGLEERGKLEILVTGQAGVSPDTLTIRCFDHNGNEVRLLPPPPLPRPLGRFPVRAERQDRRYPQPLD
jgi:ribonuclease E